MRSLESLLLVLEAAALFVFVVPRSSVWPLTRLPAIAVLPAAVAQVGLEGARWQMAPAYALSVALCLAALVPRIGAPNHPRRLAGALATGLGGLALALSLFLSLVFPVFSLPRPDGPYAVGTLTYDWVDAARPEIFQADPRVRRELMVQIWYPARGSASAKRAPYLEDGEVLAPLARLVHLPSFTFQHLKYVKTYAMPAAPVAPGAASFPVLVFSHGRGGYRQHNTAQIEELASHGYIVVAIDHPYAAAGVIFADGHRASFDARMLDRRFERRVIPYLAQDVSFTLDQLAVVNRSDPNGVLTGRLDLQRAGMFGLSLGGEVSAEACRVDPRLRACLMMDVWMPADVVASGLRQPAMWITRDAATMRRERWSQADTDQTLSTIRKVFEESPADGYFVSIPGMFHEEFSDAPFMTPLAPFLGVSGPMDARRGQAIVSAYELAFFDHYLKGTPQPLLAGPSVRLPDVLFQSRRR